MKPQDKLWDKCEKLSDTPAQAPRRAKVQSELASERKPDPQGLSRTRENTCPATAGHSPLPVTDREAKLLSMRERDAIEHDSLVKAYQETRTIEDKLRNELDEAHNDTFKAQAHAQRLADALKKVLGSMVRYEWNADPEIKVIREALAQWEQDKQ